MYVSFIVLCSVMLLLHGVSCSHYPAAARHIMDLIESHSKVAKDHKRQEPDSQCLAEEFADADLDPQCVAALAGLQIDPNDSPSQAQAAINAAYSEFCKPECGDPVLGIYLKCGADQDDVDFLAALCGTQSNGDKCYESFVSGINFIDNAETCYEDIVDGGSCDCKSDLESAVDEQGCCTRIYDDAAASTSDGKYDEGALFNSCGVTLPGGCNNSPISSSMPLASTATAIATALILSVGLVLY